MHLVGSSAFTGACSAGTPGSTSGTGMGQRDTGQFQASSNSTRSPNTCAWYDAHEPADSALWAENSPAEGYIGALRCGPVEDDGSGAGGPVDFQFFPFESPATAPPPDPSVLAAQATSQLLVPEPRVGVGPDRTKLAVNLWVWLWTDNPGPLTSTAAAGGVSVTAIASLSSVTWSLGEPAATGGPYVAGPPISITCQGTGNAPPTTYDWTAEPPCGHKFTWMSTQERTGGTGKWPITATSNWTVTWQSNTGVSGSGTLSATGNDALEIGEYRTVLVHGPGG